MQQLDNQLTDVYKDVVIIGNGPSGICLSYLLAGNWPHYTGEAHPADEMLTARLRYGSEKQQSSCGTVDVGPSSPCPGCQQQQQQMQQKQQQCMVLSSQREDLENLTCGLEGRNSARPLSLLMDQLQHPCLDAGLDLPALLDWHSAAGHPEHKLVDHVVLGKGPPGGAWNSLDPNVLTISLSRWMSLPGLDLRHWLLNLNKEERRQKLAYFSEKTDIDVNYNSSRVPIGIVAAYYSDYVVKQGLEKYFRCGTVVTSVKPIPGAMNGTKDYGWLVQGYENESGRAFEYRCKRVVLATGTTDSSNRLGVSGEETYNWVTHDLKTFEKKLDEMRTGTRLEICKDQSYERQLSKGQKERSRNGSGGGGGVGGGGGGGAELPVLVVGSGLSAADAIMAARFRGVPVLHVFRSSAKAERKRSLDKLQWLPASIYPEYHKVYEMMADRSKSYPLYKALPDYGVVDFSLGTDKYARTKTRKLTLCSPQGRLLSYRISLAAVLIGSKPDLSYLQNCGVGLGKIADKPIDSRSNHMDVDVFSYEVQRAPRKGLYAIGPLAGDNFVRFILGGAFAVLADIFNESV